MGDFKTKKAREEWLRSDEAWIVTAYCPPVRMSELWLNGRHFIKIQRLFRRSHYDIEKRSFVYDDEVILPDTATQICEVDIANVILNTISIKELVEIMIEEGL